MTAYSQVCDFYLWAHCLEPRSAPIPMHDLQERDYQHLYFTIYFSNHLNHMTTEHKHMNLGEICITNHNQGTQRNGIKS